MALAVMALGLFSCADEPDKYEVASGLPSVSYVRCLSTEIEGPNDEPDMHYTNGELVTEAFCKFSIGISEVIRCGRISLIILIVKI